MELLHGQRHRRSLVLVGKGLVCKESQVQFCGNNLFWSVGFKCDSAERQDSENELALRFHLSPSFVYFVSYADILYTPISCPKSLLFALFWGPISISLDCVNLIPDVLYSYPSHMAAMKFWMKISSLWCLVYVPNLLYERVNCLESLLEYRVTIPQPHPQTFCKHTDIFLIKTK